VRRHPQVHQDAHDRVVAEKIGVRVQRVVQLAEGRVHDADATLELSESLRGGGSGIGVSVDAKNAKLWRVGQECEGVTAAAQRGVDDHASGLTGEELDDLTLEHRYVKYVLGHLQPFNRQDGRAGGGGFSTRLDDCQAAHGPRPILLLHSIH